MLFILKNGRTAFKHVFNYSNALNETENRTKQSTWDSQAKNEV